MSMAEPDAADADPFAVDPDELPRDRFKRPLVFPIGGGKRRAVTRCTTYVGGLEDTYKLGLWQQRHVAVGLAKSAELVRQVDAWKDNRDELDRIVDEAKELAGANDASRRGTLMHRLSELADKGETVEAGDGVPDDCLPDLAAYIEATQELSAISIEQFSVQDTLGVGGTPDRVVRYKGQRYIADLKTGSIDFGTLKIAAQLAMYARSATYDVRGSNAIGDFATREQAKALRGTHGASVEKGIVIHLPAREGVCRLYWIDLLLGWRAVLVGRDVREQRAIKYRDLITDFDAPGTPGHAPASDETVQHELDLLGAGDRAHDVDGKESSRALLDRLPAPLADQILGCADRDTLLSLWKLNAASWTDELTALAKEHLRRLAS